MKVQVLIATMNQLRGDYSLLDKMNIQTDAIICNQCDRNEFEEFKWNGNSIRWLSFSEHGVGLNRNNALMRATGDIVVFADDDMIYVDGYDKIIIESFLEEKRADVIVFNIGDPLGKRKQNLKKNKVNCFNYLRYGTARIAVRLSSIKLAGIFFNQCFGGGTEHCHGEDSLFLTTCLQKGLKIFSSTDVIAELTEERESSWDNGDINKYISDQGTLYRQISRHWWKLLCLQDVCRRAKKEYNIPVLQAYRKMTNQ